MHGGTEWKQEKEIGRGAFGIVTSWVHRVTNERIVIKQVNAQQRLDKETRRKWDNEIRLMNTMQHKNVVKGKPVPEDIKRQINNPVDLLGLEVCDRDLRKVLSQPINCCGLKEKTVLSILRDVGCGIRYLHEVEKITHRDLKPENILLNFCRNETVYKITDLGYAKRIDPQSICMSFVGTLQYLAPELYECNPDTGSGYTYTADYWSFGTVLFECLTGERPFLLADAPVEWYKLIKNKKDEEIWGYNDEKAGAKFFTELPSQHWISEPLLNEFKGWLQLVLKQDPKKRGKNTTTDVAEWSGDHILDLKIIHVFNTISCSEIAYINQDGRSGTDLKTFIEARLNIPKTEQLLLSVNGSIVSDVDPLNDDLFQDTIYLFSKNPCAQYSINLEFPSHVEESIKSPDGHHFNAWWRKTCTQSLYYCSNTAYKYKCLLRGLRALVIHIMSTKKNMLTLKESLNEHMVKLDTVIELYTTMCKSDVSYLKQNDSANGLDYEKECDYVLREFQSFSKPDLSAINDKFSLLHKNMVEIEHSDVMDKFAEKAENIYVSFLRSSDPHKKTSSTVARDMSVILRDCRGLALEKHDQQMKNLKCMMKQCEDISSFNSSMEKNILSLEKKYKYVMEKQLHRQLRLLRKINTSSSPMPSLSSTSSMQGLECAIEKVEIVASSIDLPPGLITTISNNFNKLKEITRSNGSYSTSDHPNSFGNASLASVNNSMNRLPSFKFQHEDALPSFEFTSVDKREIDGVNDEMQRGSSSTNSNLRPITGLDQPSFNNEPQFRFNERVQHGKPWADQLRCPPNVQTVQPSRQAINLSSTPQVPDHHVPPSRAAAPMLPQHAQHAQHAQMVMMMHPYTDTSSMATRSESWQHTTHPRQLDSLYYQPLSAVPQRGSSISRPQHAPQSSSLYANMYAAASFHPNSDPELPSYNLRMQEFSNPPLSMNRVHNGNGAHQYSETDSSKNPPQVYQRGFFMPIYGDLMSQ